VSVVPNNEFESADSLNLITFSIEDRLNAAAFDIDTWTQYRAFWKSLILRNLHSTLDLSYRVNPDDVLRTIRANSERPVQGWGSYLHVEQGGTPDYEVDLVAVTYLNALKGGPKSG